jgi:hypothetical protein
MLPHGERKRPKVKIKIGLDGFNKCVIRRAINEFHFTEGERPTLKSLLVKGNG